MVNRLLAAAVFLTFGSSAAFGHMAPSPVPVPVAFEGPMNPFAACAAEAQEQFLSGPAYDSFVQSCEKSAIANVCEAWATERNVPGKQRASFTKKCVRAVEQAER
jgi:hypothetical protein